MATSAVPYRVDQKVWIPCETNGWRKCTVIQALDKRLTVRTAEGEKLEVETPVLVAESADVNAADLRNLTPLHDATVLENIRRRFAADTFYTYTGESLIALNPMKPVHLYGSDIVWQYHNVKELAELANMPPHIFAVGETAFRNMREGNRPQSIIVSGESGAGKTVTSRYLLQYFAMVAGKERAHLERQRQIERKIVLSNAILEAFGNATTLRNENSSRFGKYLNLCFGDDGRVCGASIQTYLLELSRVVHHSSGERSFHIFYQLCHGTTEEERAQLLLRPANEYMYTSIQEARKPAPMSPSSTPKAARMASIKMHMSMSKIRHATAEEDKAEFSATRQALEDVGVDHDLQMAMFRVLAGILHLGEVSIKEDRNGKSLIDVDSGSSLHIAAEFFGVNVEELHRVLVSRRIVTRGEVFFTPTNPEEAMALKDSLSKAVYLALFLWTVDRINYGTACASYAAAIGILDIYGFECFANNSLEQLCINYANEKLQQQFVSHVFRLEQALYENEEIVWSFVEFTDNRPCLELIEGPQGIISLLDEQCSLRRAVDAVALTTCIYNAHKDHPAFSGDRAGPSTCMFTLRHYAMDVTYDTSQFITKNMDNINPEFIELMQVSTIDFVQTLFDQDALRQHLQADGPAYGRRSGPSTVCARFKASLGGLMDVLDSTQPHYIRCIKPNAQQSGYLSTLASTLDPDTMVTNTAVRVRSTTAGPTMFDGRVVLDQLHAAGVLDVVRIAQAGYPYRWSFGDFLFKYHGLLSVHDSLRDSRAICQELCASVCGEPCDGIQFGVSVVFMRANEMFALDHALYLRQTAAATTIQAHVRGMRDRAMVRRWHVAAIKLQTAIRAAVQRRWYAQTRLATWTLQRVMRGWIRRIELQKNKRRTLLLQSVARRALARTAYSALRISAITIQSHIRAHLNRQRYRAVQQQRLESAVVLQRATRTWLEALHDRREREAQVQALQQAIERIQKGGKRETVADVLASANTTADQTVFADLAVREHDTASVECRDDEVHVYLPAGNWKRVQIHVTGMTPEQCTAIQVHVGEDSAVDQLEQLVEEQLRLNMPPSPAPDESDSVVSRNRDFARSRLAIFSSPSLGTGLGIFVQEQPLYDVAHEDDE